MNYKEIGTVSESFGASAGAPRAPKHNTAQAVPKGDESGVGKIIW